MERFVRHKLSGKTMRLKKEYVTLVTCWLNECDVIYVDNRLTIDTCIIRKENCIFIENSLQLSLF